MRKIPTLFVRDPDDRRYVLDEITPGCEWVVAGQGVATRKYDGTCVMFDGARWWARREVKPGKPTPTNFAAEETDDVTGKTVGWEPIGQSSFAKFHAEALTSPIGPYEWTAGTYELVGPKINGNPEKRERHTLIRHETAEPLRIPHPGDHDSMRDHCLIFYRDFGIEGVVFHHPDGRMAKIKARDFRKGAAD